MPSSNSSQNRQFRVLKKQANCDDLFFYQKGDALYQLTYKFCQRFLPKYGDRTVDQMVQAARSGKQNIAEGLADGVTSTEMQIKLLNVGRSSFLELCKDFLDYLGTRDLSAWDTANPRFNKMLKFCREHNKAEEYKPFFEIWTDEEMANVAITLCHIIDKLMTNYISAIEEEFVTQGGIKERMYAARTGYRKTETEELANLRAENNLLKQRIAVLEQQLAQSTLKK